MISAASTPLTTDELTARLAALQAQGSAREQRIGLLEEENRWLKSQLFGRSSERSTPPDISPDQGWLFNEAEALASAAQIASPSVSIAAHDRRKRGRKKLSPDIPRIEVVQDLPENEKFCPTDGAALVRIGEEIAEQLDYQPAKLRVIQTIRPKYACPCCRQGVHIAPVAAQLLPKSLATPSLLAQITTAKFVDGLPLYRQEPQFQRLGVTLGRATMAGWMIQLGGKFVVPLINLMKEQLLEQPLIRKRLGNHTLVA